MAGFGLYIHWPFCAAKCPYCDFNSHVSAQIDQDRWKRAYLAEIKRLGTTTGDRILGSVYFGGGTPSLMDVTLIEAILDSVRATWTISNDCEITLEANPTSVEAGRFIGYRDAGVSRVSIGVQALVDEDLKALGRLHNAEDALNAVATARNVFERVSFDLIYGRMNQTLGSWKTELGQALTMEPNHLSLYQLTIEAGTAFGERHRRGTLIGLPEEDLAADLFIATQELCDAAGLPAYEISNHARPNFESRHNLTYWRSGDYAGIGPGAHGRLTFLNTRYATSGPLSPREWLERVESGVGGDTVFNPLDPEETDAEALMMGLRLTEGTDLNRLNRSDKYINSINMLQEIELLRHDTGNLRATPNGRRLLDSIITALLQNRDDRLPLPNSGKQAAETVETLQCTV